MTDDQDNTPPLRQPRRAAVVQTGYESADRAHQLQTTTVREPGHVQFFFAVRHRLKALHRGSGRIFTVSGMIFGFYCHYSPILELAFGIARTFGWPR
jgi:hypothetical protein